MSSFASLPPHWRLVNPLANERVALAMEMMYGRILTRHKNTADDPTAMLLRCLACIVFHSEAILATMIANPGHDFCKLSILHNPGLLHDLRLLVTTAPTEGVMATPTGIPPHVELASQLKEILQTVTEVVCSLKDQTARIIEVVKTTIDEKSWDSGQVTGSRLREILATFHEEAMGAVNSRLDGIVAEFQRISGGVDGGDGGNLHNFDGDEEERAGTERQPNCTFAYGGHFYDVPQGFCFPKVTLREGLRFWLKGQTVSTDGSKVVKPFRQLELVGLPDQALKNVYKVAWKPIFSYLEEHGAYEVPRNSRLMTDVAIEGLYDQCVNFLKENVAYCFAGVRANPTKWGLGTWSLKTRRSNILKKGTEADKAKVAEATNRNRARTPNTRPGRHVAPNPLYRYRQRQRVQRLIRNNLPPQNNLQQEAAQNQQEPETPAAENQQEQETPQEDGQADEFANAFGMGGLSEAARARQRDIEQEVALEFEQERQATGTAVGEDGGFLYVRRTTGEAPLPGTEAHRVWLRRQVNNLPTFH
jgi:hypothetical protein